MLGTRIWLDCASTESWLMVLVSLPVQGHKRANPAADPRKMRRIIAEDPEWYANTP